MMGEIVLFKIDTDAASEMRVPEKTIAAEI